ncbi:hypothetical protein LSAT2_022202 [Lamellibrachia satsuma]|nr:hypothetical protein LSAT2_022202 [Lamellibrachia satsuma]
MAGWVGGKHEAGHATPAAAKFRASWVRAQSAAPRNDISPTSGSVFFVSHESRQVLTINVLPDDEPEGPERRYGIVADLSPTRDVVADLSARCLADDLLITNHK